MGTDTTHADWALDDDYTVSDVASRVIEMYHDELYEPWVSTLPPQQDPDALSLGFVVAGTSGGSSDAEAWAARADAHRGVIDPDSPTRCSGLVGVRPADRREPGLVRGFD